MVLFKINGERNSGTNCLEVLFKLNFGKQSVYVQHNEQNTMYYWKHGLPCNTIKSKDDTVIDIFIIRNLEPWLMSMFNNPYHLVSFDNFNDFLTNYQKSNETYFKDFRTNNALNADDNNKTIFDIRYYKLKHIFDYYQNNDNVIIVNLDIIQDEPKCHAFLQDINNKYNINNLTKYILRTRHTRTGKYDKNTTYNIDIELLPNYKTIINKYIDHEVENKIQDIKLIHTKQNE
jgi:hypothetical protein